MNTQIAIKRNDYRDLHALTDEEFSRFQALIFQMAGIHMNHTKRSLVAGRLSKRLRHYGIHSYGEYLEILEKDGQEKVLFVDLLTTNETYFFREPKHFEFLQEHFQSQRFNRETVSLWSAACSTGEEPYSLAMTLMNVLGNGAWHILATDINHTVLEHARAGRYPLAAAQKIPQPYLFKYCLQGVREKSGMFLIAKTIRERIHFQLTNLNADFPEVGQFDFIFLRNVMIYFSQETKRKLVERLVWHLKPGGHLIVGHSESLSGVHPGLKLVRPSIYILT